jgi:heterotetrameric sarcosine oxidase gamma subunit
MHPSPLRERARQAGARFAIRDGWEVASSYGAVAAEVAACRSTAGIADQSHVGKLELEAPGAALRACIAHQAGGALEPGIARADGPRWWCPLGDQRALVLVEHGPVDILGGALERELGPAGGSVADVSSQFAAVAIAGPRARALLARVTEIDLARGALSEGGFRVGPVTDVPAMLLRERDDRFLLLCGSADAEYLWLALSDAGRPLGVVHVGVEALERLAAVRPG